MKYSSLIILFLLSGCVTRRACDRKFPCHDRDSIQIITKTITTIRDTTVYIQIPGDTVFESVPASGIDFSTLKTSLAVSEAWISDGKLNHRLAQKDTAVASKIKGVIKTTRQQESKNEVTHKTEYVNRLTGWQWFQIYSGRFFAVILVLLILMKSIGKYKV